MHRNGQEITCTNAEIKELKAIAESRTTGIWRIKRAKVILGTLEGKSVDRLVLDVRVPPESIKKCLKSFASLRLKYFEVPVRKPTSREAAVEKVLAFLENPEHSKAKQWHEMKVHYIGHEFSARKIKKIRDMISSNPTYTRAESVRKTCKMFGLYQTNGKLKVSGVCNILKRMDMDNIIKLPLVSCKRRKKNTGIKYSILQPPQTMFLDGSQIKYLQFIPVTKKEDHSLWNDLIANYHYIGGYRLFGAQMKYLVYGGNNITPPVKTSNSLYSARHKKAVPKKAIYIYPLCKDFREILCNT